LNKDIVFARSPELDSGSNPALFFSILLRRSAPRNDVETLHSNI